MLAVSVECALTHIGRAFCLQIHRGNKGRKKHKKKKKGKDKGEAEEPAAEAASDEV